VADIDIRIELLHSQDGVGRNAIWHQPGAKLVHRLDIVIVRAMANFFRIEPVAKHCFYGFNVNVTENLQFSDGAGFSISIAVTTKSSASTPIYTFQCLVILQKNLTPPLRE